MLSPPILLLLLVANLPGVLGQSCPTNYAYNSVTTSCYNYRNGATNYATAKAFCESGGAHLIIIDSTEEVG